MELLSSSELIVKAKNDSVMRLIRVATNPPELCIIIYGSGNHYQGMQEEAAQVHPIMHGLKKSSKFARSVCVLLYARDAYKYTIQYAI